MVLLRETLDELSRDPEPACDLAEAHPFLETGGEDRDPEVVTSELQAFECIVDALTAVGGLGGREGRPDLLPRLEARDAPFEHTLGDDQLVSDHLVGFEESLDRTDHTVTFLRHARSVGPPDQSLFRAPCGSRTTATPAGWPLAER